MYFAKAALAYRSENRRTMEIWDITELSEDKAQQRCENTSI